MVTLGVKTLPHYTRSDLPAYAHDGDSGFDLRAAITEPVRIPPGKVISVPTGLCFDIPRGYEIQIRGRSGLAVKGVTVPNAPGTVDSTYKGEIKVLLMGAVYMEPVTINPGDRVAQAVLAPVVHDVDFVSTTTLSDSTRGGDGFGSSGVA